MKKILISTFFILLTLASALAQKSNAQTFEFKPTSNAVIEIGSLNDGNHTFVSASGYKLVLTIKNHTIVDHQYFTPGGGPMTTAKSADSAIRDALSRCSVCTTIKLLNGQTTQICSDVECHSAQGIQNSLK